MHSRQFQVLVHLLLVYYKLVKFSPNSCWPLTTTDLWNGTTVNHGWPCSGQAFSDHGLPWLTMLWPSFLTMLWLSFNHAFIPRLNWVAISQTYGLNHGSIMVKRKQGSTIGSLLWLNCDLFCFVLFFSPGQGTCLLFQISSKTKKIWYKVLRNWRYTHWRFRINCLSTISQT